MSAAITTARILAVVAVAGALAACGGGGAGDDAGGTDAAAGQVAFERYCISCHGAQAQGTEQGPPLVHEVYEPSHHPDDAFRQAAANGVQPHHWEFGPMPPVPAISEAEVDAVIAYVRGLQREAGIE